MGKIKQESESHCRPTFNHDIKNPILIKEDISLGQLCWELKKNGINTQPYRVIVWVETKNLCFGSLAYSIEEQIMNEHGQLIITTTFMLTLKKANEIIEVYKIAKEVDLMER